MNIAAQLKVNEDQINALDLFRKMKFDLRQNIMSCGLVTPLQNILITKIVIRLWHHGIREELKQKYFASRPGCRILYFKNILKMFSEKVLENASSLMLPKYFDEMMKEKIKIIGNELENYFRSQSLFISTYQENKKKAFVHYENLCWTQEGKINKLKTVENIIENSNLSMKDKYILSCNYCLKEKIQDLFQKLPCSIITGIFNNYCQGNDYKDTGPHLLVQFWTFYFRERNISRAKLINEDLTYEHLLKWALRTNNDVAFQYVWENFAFETEKEQLMNFINLPKDLWYINDNCFLFLCSQRRHFELKDLLLVEIMNFVVITLDRISRYYKVELVPAYVHEFIKTHNIWDSSNLLRFNMMNILDSNTYVNISEKFSLHFANDIG